MMPSAQPAASAGKYKFEENETVLCHHRGSLYVAKILKRVLRPLEDATGEVPTYKVHYHKWSKKNDEFVSEQRLLKDDPENRKLLPQKKPPKLQQKKAAKKRPTAASAAGGDPKAKQAKTTPRHVETMDEFLAQREVRLSIPLEIKKALVADFQAVVKRKKLVQLPPQITVTAVLDQFVEAGVARGRSKFVLNELTDGLKTYFRQCLDKQLLYVYERSQFQALASEQSEMDICLSYGTVHLLRLLVKLPALLVHTEVGVAGMRALVHLLEDLLKYIAERPELLDGTYIEASKRYKSVAALEEPAPAEKRKKTAASAKAET